jgi:hypothetical protein
MCVCECAHVRVYAWIRIDNRTARRALKIHAQYASNCTLIYTKYRLHTVRIVIDCSHSVEAMTTRHVYADARDFATAVRKSSTDHHIGNPLARVIVHLVNS